MELEWGYLLFAEGGIRGKFVFVLLKFGIHENIWYFFEGDSYYMVTRMVTPTYHNPSQKNGSGYLIILP